MPVPHRREKPQSPEIIKAARVSKHLSRQASGETRPTGSPVIDPVFVEGATKLEKPRRRTSPVPRRNGHKYTFSDPWSEFAVARGGYYNVQQIPRWQNPYLRPNAKFIGEQQSASNRYEIKVQFRTVDLGNSLITGFFQIQGLTDEHPLITTCFKGDIINNPLHRLDWGYNESVHTTRHSFLTEELSWDSFPKNDLDHWRKLTGSPVTLLDDDLKSKLKRIYEGKEDRHCVYMRWKEEFLVPDARVKKLKDASFEGFYYAVLNVGGGQDRFDQFSSGTIPGTISGLYFHNKSERFQLLSLRHLPTRGDLAVFEMV